MPLIFFIVSAVAFSRNFYGYNSRGQLDKDLTRNEIDEYFRYRLGLEEQLPRSLNAAIDDLYKDANWKLILSRRCSMGVFPRSALQLTEGRTYWIQRSMECPLTHSLGIEDALLGQPEFKINKS